MIGAFALGAAVLAVAGVLVFGGGRFFADTVRFVVCFRGSLKGLSVGSPVTLSGVQVGSVEEISVLLDVETFEQLAPVVIEVERSAFRRVRDGRTLDADPAPDAHGLAEMLTTAGFRAQLQTRNFVTGMLQVALEFRPGSEPRLTGIESAYPELATIPTSIEQIARTLENLPFEEMVANLQSTAEAIDELVNSADLRRVVQSLDELVGNLKAVTDAGGLPADLRGLLAEARCVIERTDSRIDLIVAAVGTALAEGRRMVRRADTETLRRLDALIERTDGQVQSVGGAVAETLASAESVIRAASAVLQSVEAAASGPAGVRQDVNAALRELNAAARAVRELADYLERHPESLVYGKGGR